MKYLIYLMILLTADFSEASGADAMLVTTGDADGEKVKLGSNTLTFRFFHPEMNRTLKCTRIRLLLGNKR